MRAEEEEALQLKEWAEHSPWVLTKQSIPTWLAERNRFVWTYPVPYLQGKYSADVPAGDGVYVLFAEPDNRGLLYIGKSSQLCWRVRAHWKEGRIPFTHVGWIETPGDSADVLEAYMIGEIQPPMNVKFCPRMGWWHAEVAAALAARTP